MLYNLYWYMFLHLNSLDEWHLMDLSLYLGLRYYDGNLDVFFNFPNLNLCLINDFWNLDFNYFILFDYPENLSNHLYLFRWQLNYLFNSYNLLDDLRLNNKYLLCMYNRYYFFDNLFYDLDSGFYMRNDLRNLFISNYFNYFFDYLWNYHYFLFLNNLLYDFFNNHLNLLNHLFFSLDISNHLLDDLYWL